MIIKKIHTKLKNQDGTTSIRSIDLGIDINNIQTTDSSQFISKKEKEKLSLIEDKANNYTHPTGDGHEHIPSGGILGQVLKKGAAGYYWGEDENNEYNLANTTNDGLMSSADYISLRNKADKSLDPINTYIAVENWTGEESPYSITINVPGATTNNNIEVMIANTCTVDEYEAWCSASIGCGTQTTNSITLKAFGDKAAIPIPITIIVRNDH